MKLKSFKFYKRPKNTVLIPVYKQGLVYELTNKDYEDLKLVGIKAIKAPSGMYILF